MESIEQKPKIETIEHRFYVNRVEVSGQWTKDKPPKYYEMIEIHAESDDPWPDKMRLAFRVADVFARNYPLYTELTVSIRKDS